MRPRLLPEASSLLSTFIGESGRYEGRPPYEWIVLQARARELAGAAVLQGVIGYGAIQEGVATLEKAWVKFYRPGR